MKRQLCSVSRAVTKTFQVAPPNTDIEGWERDILDIIERENVTDLIPTSEEVCHVANLAPRLPDTTRYVGPSAEWIAQWHDKLAVRELRNQPRRDSTLGLHDCRRRGPRADSSNRVRA